MFTYSIRWFGISVRSQQEHTIVPFVETHTQDCFHKNCFFFVSHLSYASHRPACLPSQWMLVVVQVKHKFQCDIGLIINCTPFNSSKIHNNNGKCEQQLEIYTSHWVQTIFSTIKLMAYCFVDFFFLFVFSIHRPLLLRCSTFGAQSAFIEFEANAAHKSCRD